MSVALIRSSGVSLVTASTVAVLLAITWGGLRFSWTSFHVLVPLVLGAVGVVGFFIAEYLWLKGPTVRFCASPPPCRTLMRRLGPSILLHESHYTQWVSESASDD